MRGSKARLAALGKSIRGPAAWAGVGLFFCLQTFLSYDTSYNMAYKSTRRQWVKLWVNEWLDGTSRFELTPQQRLLWVDLLALAGRSRFPGEIYAGMSGDNKKVGYPIEYLAGVLQMDKVTTNNALKLLQAHCHITLEESAPDVYVIGIINWEKYQSEYLRQKTYRKVTTKTTSRLPVEGEVEEEGEVEVEDRTAAAFRAIGFEVPFGSALFQGIWVNEFCKEAPWLTMKMEATIQYCQRKHIGIPPQFYSAKHDVEKSEMASLKGKTL